jgi:hypothetical protein
MLPEPPATSLSANEDLGFEDLGFEDLGSEDLGFEDLGSEDLGFEDLGFEDLGSEDLGSTAFVQLKMARAAELVCKLYHNSPDRVLPASRLQPRGYVDKILLERQSTDLERQSTDQALRVITVGVACRGPRRLGARSRQSFRTKTK